MTIDVSKTEEIAAEIRPGVLRPDWLSVTTAAARQALRGRAIARAGLLDRWSHALEADEDLVWRSVLQLYADIARPPRPDEIEVATDIPQDRVRALLDELARRDLLGLEPGTGAIRYAYPFTQMRTEHRAELRGQVLDAMCAIDALGVGAMYRADISVESACRLCGEPIRVVTAAEGRSLCSTAPADAVVWYDFAYDGAAAASCCPRIAFFCARAHLQRWLDAQKPHRDGIMLAMDEALEVGRAIFGSVLEVSAPRDQGRF